LNSLISLTWVIGLALLIHLSRLSGLICRGLWVSLTMLRLRSCLAVGSRTVISIVGCLVSGIMLRGILSPQWRLPMRILLGLSRACRYSTLICCLLLLLLLLMLMLMLLLVLVYFVISLMSDMHVVGTTMMLLLLLLWLILAVRIGLIGLVKQRCWIQSPTVPLV